MPGAEITIDAPSTRAQASAPARPQVACAHCGLAVPSGLIDPAAAMQFCCNGCRTVHAVIHGCGLERFYRLRAADPGRAAAAAVSGRTFGELDDPAFAERWVEHRPDGLTATELLLEGIHCAACVWLVEKLPAVAPGVIEARLDLRRGVVRVVWDPRRTPLSAVARALDSLGYTPHPVRDGETRSMRRREDRAFLVRIGVAGAAAGNVMVLAFALYGGLFSGIEAEFAGYFRWMSMLLGVLALAWPGSVFFRGAWAALRTRTAHLDLPIALGLAAGGLMGTINTLRGAGEIYFDSLTVLVFLLLVGRWIQRRQQRWAADAVQLLYTLTPAFARRIESGGGPPRDIPLEAVRRGDLLEVRAGDTIPVDGIVELGASRVDQALLTGEPRPAAVSTGSRVAAGTLNLAAALHVRASATGADTRVGRLMALVEQSARRRTPIVQFADGLAGWFTIAVITLATLTLGVWLWLDPGHAAEHTAALLIVACPCALGLATPLAVAVAIGRAARQGILIKGGDTLETLSRRGLVLFDKTGTLTQGRASLVRWSGDASAQPLVAALEAHSSHPIAKALCAAFREESPLPTTDVTQVSGAGVEGLVAGRRVRVGSIEYVPEPARAACHWLNEAVAQCIAEGLTPVVVCVDGTVAALAAVGDAVRPDAREAIAALRARGWRAGILSGDHPQVVATVARQVGIDPRLAHGHVSPEAKLATVEAARRVGPVVMIGDGVNDAAALSAASVGIAVQGGAEASLAAAHVYLNQAGLAPVVDLLGASRRTFQAIRCCLATSLTYNAAGVLLAITGVINPLIAAVLMPLSSFTVLSIALGARTFAGSAPRRAA